MSTFTPSTTYHTLTCPPAGIQATSQLPHVDRDKSSAPSSTLSPIFVPCQSPRLSSMLSNAEYGSEEDDWRVQALLIPRITAVNGEADTLTRDKVETEVFILSRQLEKEMSDYDSGAWRCDRLRRSVQVRPGWVSYTGSMDLPSLLKKHGNMSSIPYFHSAIGTGEGTGVHRRCLNMMDLHLVAGSDQERSTQARDIIPDCRLQTYAFHDSFNNLADDDSLKCLVIVTRTPSAFSEEAHSAGAKDTIYGPNVTASYFQQEQCAATS